MNRIKVIKKSLMIYVCGIISLVPILGLLPAACALFAWAMVSSRYRNEWNPAAAYLSWGARFAVLGIIVSLFVACLAAMLLIFHEFSWMD